jgi:hypothetical protein
MCHSAVQRSREWLSATELRYPRQAQIGGIDQDAAHQGDGIGGWLPSAQVGEPLGEAGPAVDLSQ